VIARYDNQVTLREHGPGCTLSQLKIVNLCWGRTMPTGRASFHSPNCNALYQVVKQEAGPETVDGEITRRSCGGSLPAREGKFVLKYFLLSKSGRTQKWRRA
jgi:hypothetical protein